MQVHYDEGIANHIGPELFAGIREDVGEASAGNVQAQPLSCSGPSPDDRLAESTDWRSVVIPSTGTSVQILSRTAGPVQRG